MHIERQWRPFRESLDPSDMCSQMIGHLYLNVISQNTYAILRAGSHKVPNAKPQVWHGLQSWDVLRDAYTCPKYDMDSRVGMCWELRLVLRVGFSRKLDLALNTSPTNILFLYKNNQDMALLIINHISMVSWGSKVGTLPSSWDLLTCVALGAWDPMWTGPYC